MADSTTARTGATPARSRASLLWSAAATPLRRNGTDLALALFVMAVVALLIIPVTPAVLDLLLATSLAMAVMVLLVVLYVGDALGVATFPTLLLLTTLYRLALNVSTSRLILLRGYAGEVVLSFGRFVVQGNYLVGAIVFSILTIIQFIVIAKGSERVAEVAARFALDALPGKQMAIDAELRAGSIDAGEARRRRRVLSRESQFYGAMDGAMKFVKGDVIASLVITLVNIVGGLAVGVLQRGMPIAEALKKYGLLTIGDGLVTQIPALITATAAGLLVTRVASEEPDSSLGSELGAQLFGNEKALYGAAIFIGILALVPGLPAPPFLAIAFGLLVAGRARSRSKARARRDGAMPLDARLALDAAAGAPSFVPVVVPWSVEVGSALAQDLDDQGGEPGLRTRLHALRARIFQELGLPLPTPRITLDATIEASSAVISVREIPIEVVAQTLGEAAKSDRRDARKERLDAVVEGAHRSLVTHGHELLGIGETQRLLDALAEVDPAIVRQLVPKPLSVTVLAEVLRRLLEERISIRDLRTILEGVAKVATTGGQKQDPLDLAETARCALRRAMTHRLTGGASSLPVYLLDAALEDMVRGAITRTSAGAFLTLAPSAARDVVSSIAYALESTPPLDGTKSILLTAPDVRRFVQKLVEATMPELIVTSYAELEPELSLLPKARVLLL